jgi:hypothetical protein
MLTKVITLADWQLQNNPMRHSQQDIATAQVCGCKDATEAFCAAT